MAPVWLVSQLSKQARHAGPLGVFADKQDADMAAFKRDLAFRHRHSQYDYPSPITDDYLSVARVSCEDLSEEPVRSSTYSFQTAARRYMHVRPEDFERYMESQRMTVDSINERATRGIRGTGRFKMTDIGPVMDRPNLPV